MILIAVIILGLVGLVASIMLYAASKKFAVVEDERIGQVAEVLPQANCGGCGYPGCAGFAAACVKAADGGSLEGKLCPVGGQPVMEKVAGILGLAATASTPKVAVVRCNGTCANRPRVVDYDGVRSCRVQLLAGTGETAWLPEVDEERCTACGACVKTCPRRVIELRPKGPKNRRMVVMCVNRDKGAVANKVCKASCIGCGKCVKTCPFEAITLNNNLAYIDPEKCKLCRKCEEACPKGAIHAINFPPRKPKVEKPAATAAPKPAEPAAQPVSAPAAQPVTTVTSEEKKEA